MFFSVIVDETLLLLVTFLQSYKNACQFMTFSVQHVNFNGLQSFIFK